MKLSSILSNYLGELDDFCEIYIFCRVKKVLIVLDMRSSDDRHTCVALFHG